MQFEPLPEKRAVPAFVKKSPAQNVVLELMKTDASERDTLRQKIEVEQKRTDSIVTAFALQVYRKRGSADPFVRVLADLIAEYKIEIVTYEGQPVTLELEAAADIVEWLSAEDNDVECVVEAIEPEIRYQGRILHRAKLSCRKAPEPEPEPEPIESEPVEPEPVVLDKAPSEETVAPETAAETEKVDEPAETIVPEETQPTAAETESKQVKPERKRWFAGFIKKLLSKRAKPKSQEPQPATEPELMKTDDANNEKTNSEQEKGAEGHEDK